MVERYDTPVSVRPDADGDLAALRARIAADGPRLPLAYYRIKVTLRTNGVVLRGQTPNLAKQEIWALLHVYNALRDLATETAVALGLDPRPDLLRCRAPPHPHPRHQPLLLPAPRAAHRHRRPPDQPRRPAPHQPTHHIGTTSQTNRDITYTINIVSSNLPKVA
jgi:hypothetical protein